MAVDPNGVGVHQIFSVREQSEQSESPIDAGAACHVHTLGSNLLVLHFSICS